MASMNHLPNELLPLIFKHLDLKDLPNCRLVSQKWRSFIDEVKVKELVISDWYYRDCDTWYLTEAKLNPRNRISLSQVQRCPFVLADVERLKFQGISISNKFNLNEFLATFPRLCHLEINWIRANDASIELDLPASLKTIHLKLFASLQMALHLNAPQLQNVYCSCHFRHIKFSHPVSVKHMGIEYLERAHNGDADLQVFPNVEYLRCGQGSYALKRVDLLRLFPKAKEIHFKSGRLGSFADLERVIGGVIERKNILGRKDLNITCENEMVDKISFRRYIYYTHGDVEI